jgi:hypothetical protein
MKSFFRWFSGLNIYLKLIPFLLLYLAVSLLFAPDKLVSDETRYVLYARYLIKGIYTPPAPDIDLWAGRGYSALLAPFLFLKLPLIALRLLNAFLLYFSLIIFNKTIELYTLVKKVSIYTIFLGLYFPIYMLLPLIMTECLTWLLICMIIYFFIKINKQKSLSRKPIIICGFLIAFLAMTKVIFGYIIASMIVFSLFMQLFSKFRLAAKKTTYIFSVSFILCIPYLIYTYNLTGKIFYWSDSGGMSLFTMSAPYPKDYGDWKPEDQMLQNPNYKTFIQSISKLSPLDRDAAYKKQAIENIKKYPLKYSLNCLANAGRLFFGYPKTNTLQSFDMYFYLLPNMFVVSFIAITLSIGIYHFNKIPYEIFFLFFFVLIYLLGSVLLSAYCRMFMITVPFWMLFFFYIRNNVITVNIRKK